MIPTAAVDSAPATQWTDVRPEGLAPQLWAESRPTAETLAELQLPEGAVIHGRDGRLLGWRSAAGNGAELADLWLRCARAFPNTGLWPICDPRHLDEYRGWTFQVIAPPTDDVAIDRLASEVFSFATDSAIQGGFHVRDIEHNVTARELVQAREWLIWWD